MASRFPSLSWRSPQSLRRPTDCWKKQKPCRSPGLSSQEYEDAREVVLKIDEDIGRSVASRGLIHVDGKKELAFDIDRQIMVIDVYGTADEDRFWDKARYDEGRVRGPEQGVRAPVLPPDRLQRSAL